MDHGVNRAESARTILLADTALMDVMGRVLDAHRHPVEVLDVNDSIL